jgi:asparagine N-glycosylation enzyme membrane subunit Stt3
MEKRNIKTTKNNEIIKNIDFIMKNFIISVISFIFITHRVEAYTIGSSTIGFTNLWEIFVVRLCGSFSLSVVLLMGIFFFILMLGGISLLSMIVFELLFFMSMMFGASRMLALFILIGICFWSVMQSKKFIEQMGSG